MSDFNLIWKLLDFYTKRCGSFILGEPQWQWKIFNWLARINLAIFYLEFIYCGILHRDDSSQIFVYVCFFCLVNLGMSYKVVLSYYKKDVLDVLKWCERRHQFKNEQIIYHSKSIFREELESSASLLQRRITGTVTVTTVAFVLGGIFESIQSRKFDSIIPIHSPLFEMTGLLSFIYTTAHHLFAILFPLTGGLMVGGINTLITSYLIGQLRLTVLLVNDIGAKITVDRNGRMDFNLFKITIDLYNDAMIIINQFFGKFQQPLFVINQTYLYANTLGIMVSLISETVSISVVMVLVVLNVNLATAYISCERLNDQVNQIWFIRTL